MKSILRGCKHGYWWNCPVCSYNEREKAMVGRLIQGAHVVVLFPCSCDYYCANYPNCKGGGFSNPIGHAKTRR